MLIDESGHVQYKDLLGREQKTPRPSPEWLETHLEPIAGGPEEEDGFLENISWRERLDFFLESEKAIYRKKEAPCNSGVDVNFLEAHGA